MSKLRSRLVALFLVLAIGLPLVPPSTLEAQEDEVAQLMAQMSSAARVGQLFLVTFPGSEVDERAAITELIQDYKVGGVLLKPDNGNIVNEGNTPAQVARLTRSLQETAWEATRPLTDTVSDPFIPLFVAVTHEGNGMPFTSIVSGTTPLPSQMALGATWNVSHTATVGQIVGRELSGMGVNMLFGPSLDVLENPRPASSGDLGVRSFGGEPFWVGQMGKAYIGGVHHGSDQRVAVIAKHFPGLGSSDRSLDEEISTVQRTLEKLKQVDLAPFFAVAQARDPVSRPDGVMTSHIRFQGLEGGRFIATSPVSVDGSVLRRMLELPEMVAWREAGGLTVSDELGLRALQRFYAPGEQTFNNRRIAQDAFLAGNDLLLLSRFSLEDRWEQRVANIKSTITFFVEKYESDPSFQNEVDEAVARILRLKLSLYEGSFSLEDAQIDLDSVEDLVRPDLETVSAVARSAVTLLSPPSPDLVPAPPTRDDRIVIFTDARVDRPCATCQPVAYVDPGVLEDTMVELYGPAATGQVDPGRISSFTFGELTTYLESPVPTPTPTPAPGETITPTVSLLSPVGVALQNADWIIFGMLKPTSAPPVSAAVQQFLADRVDTLRGPNVVVMAYDIPYGLDATEISKLSAYYALYDCQPASVRASVRALFGEFAPRGNPPVSVVGLNYDLLTQTSPDPDQIIPVYYAVTDRVSEEEGTEGPPVGDPPLPDPTEEDQPAGEPETEGQVTPEPRLERGDQIRLRTGVILDHNGNIVPDGTSVQFVFSYPQEGLEQSVVAPTQNGVSEASLTLDRTGRLDISVQADPVPRRVALQITIQEGGAATIVTPTPTATAVPTATPTPLPEPTPTDEPAASPTPLGVGETDTDNGGRPRGRLQVLDLLLAILGAIVVSGSGYHIMRLGDNTVARALRVALWCMVGGLALYLVYAFSLAYLGLFGGSGERWAAGGAALVGSAIFLFSAWLVDRRRWTETVEFSD